MQLAFTPEQEAFRAEIRAWVAANVSPAAAAAVPASSGQRPQDAAFQRIANDDRPDEVVIIGGHIDSWDLGTGATDNAAGCAVGMEAVRIIKSLGLKPRRTIRIALWSGEEQGLHGSRQYVKKHFGAKVAIVEVDEVVAGQVRDGRSFGPAAGSGKLAVRGPDGDLLAIYEAREGQFRPVKVLAGN